MSEIETVIAGCRATARKVAAELIALARRLNDVAETAPCRESTRLLFTRDEVLTSFNFLRLVTGRDFHDLLKYTHHFAAIDGARYHSDEEWATHCAHLDREIVRLQALVDAGQDEA